MTLAFILTMPGVGSWNGKWTGEGKTYAIVRAVRGEQVKRANDIIGSHCYGWSDGWLANIEVRVVDAKEARRLRAKSAGFYGYDWMVSDLLEHGKIRPRIGRSDK